MTDKSMTEQDSMTRAQAVAKALEAFDSGAFRQSLARRIALATESQNPSRADAMSAYLRDEMIPSFSDMGFSCRLLKNPKGGPDFLFVERIEGHAGLTVLGYGHGDVIHGQQAQWGEGLEPWRLVERDGAWYGRGIADNKGQHTVNMTALRAVLDTRGKLGFNAKYLIEMGEEIGSPGLREICAQERELFRADLLIASDGPRLDADRPTVFLGSRGDYSFDMWVEARDHPCHSGNWGGVAANPGIELAHAISSVVGQTGKILVPEWVPGSLPDSVRKVLGNVELSNPDIDAWWGEPGLTPAERLFAWSSFEVLAYRCGDPDAPVNAIPANARARCQLRFVVGVDQDAILPSLRAHLDGLGFARVQIAAVDEEKFGATRLDPENRWVSEVARSLALSSGKEPVVLPNFGGSLPNDIFADVLELPAIWIPHSYPGCRQHGPDEHLPGSLLREGLGLMAGLYFDLGGKG